MDPNFPLHLWCRILRQCQDTLDMLRTSRLYPHISSFTHINGPFDYNATPMAPPGIRTLVYETPQQLKTWAQHGVDALYIGYCPDHYCCHNTYVPATRRERIAHTVSFLPHDFAVPANNHQDNVARSIRYLTTALQHRYLHTLLQPVVDKQFAAIQALEQIFCPDLPYLTTQPPIIPTQPPSVVPAPIHTIVELPTATLPTQLSRLTAPVSISTLSQEHSANKFDRHRYPTRFSVSHKTYSMACTNQYSYAAAHLSKTPAPPVHFHENMACSVINPDTGVSLE